MSRPLLYLNTIKHLKSSQIFYRLKKIFLPRSLPKKRNIKSALRPKEWKSFNFHSSSFYEDKKITFLNLTKQLSLPKDWKFHSYGKLWLYNLHYFDYLSNENRLSYSQKSKLIENWIQNNQNPNETGWDPYPTSLRVVNLIKFWLSGAEYSNNIHKSIQQQSTFLYNNLELDLLGNHFFANLKALLFFSVVYQETHLKKFVVNQLTKQINEQILNDGAHFELSPMYHRIILADMLDIYNLVLSTKDLFEEQFISLIKEKIVLMVHFMKIMRHHDNEIPFFNDSAFSIAPEYKKLIAYCGKLDIPIPSDCNKLNSIEHMKESGFIVLKNENIKIFFDVGDVGAKYIPGHGHADALSFEMSYQNQRIFVNSGTSTYEKNHLRNLQRKTLSHNTVEIDSNDSSQVWDGFRVGNRSKILDCGFRDYKNKFEIYGVHDGFSSYGKKVLHHRKISSQKDAITIHDLIEGNHNAAVARFYVHPEIEVKVHNKSVFLEKDYIRFKLTFESSLPYIENTSWYPEFNKSIKNKCITFNFKDESKVLIEIVSSKKNV